MMHDLKGGVECASTQAKVVGTNILEQGNNSLAFTDGVGSKTAGLEIAPPGDVSGTTPAVPPLTAGVTSPKSTAQSKIPMQTSTATCVVTPKVKRPVKADINFGSVDGRSEAELSKKALITRHEVKAQESKVKSAALGAQKAQDALDILRAQNCTDPATIEAAARKANNAKIYADAVGVDAAELIKAYSIQNQANTVFQPVTFDATYQLPPIIGDNGDAFEKHLQQEKSKMISGGMFNTPTVSNPTGGMFNTPTISNPNLPAKIPAIYLTPGTIDGNSTNNSVSSEKYYDTVSDMGKLPDPPRPKAPTVSEESLKFPDTPTRYSSLNVINDNKLKKYSQSSVDSHLRRYSLNRRNSFSGSDSLQEFSNAEVASRLLGNTKNSRNVSRRNSSDSAHNSNKPPGKQHFHPPRSRAERAANRSRCSADSVDLPISKPETFNDPNLDGVNKSSNFNSQK